MDPLDQFMLSIGKMAAHGKQHRGDLDDDTDSDVEPDTGFLEMDLDGTQPVLRRAPKKELEMVDHRLIKYEKIQKDFLGNTLQGLDQTRVKAYRSALSIRINGHQCPQPIQRFSQCGMTQRILSVLQRYSFLNPTPIQSQLIPAIMKGRDVIGVASTGSGKTLGYVLPMFRHIMAQRPLSVAEGPIGVVMAPTRELAVQITLEIQKFTRRLGLRVVCAYGGSEIKNQISSLRRGAEIVVGTPGRFMDLLCASSGKVTNLRRCTFVVLDEADRMFDLGFEPQVSKIVANIRPDRQMVFCSATFPRSVEMVARRLLNDPLEIIVGGRSVVCRDVDQKVIVVPEDQKFVQLLEILGQVFNQEETKVLIFVDRQESADNLFKDLLRRGYVCMSIHGAKDQGDRDCSLQDFKRGHVPILVATSVAARGLDVKDLGLVINYDTPNHMEDYVHRVGRTGRAGNKGTAITFITPEQKKYSRDLIWALRASGAKVPPELEELWKDFEHQVQHGEASYSSRGFGGKGLEKIDQERDKMLQNQKQSFGDAEDPIPFEPPVQTHPPKKTLGNLDQIVQKINTKIREQGGTFGQVSPQCEACVSGKIYPVGSTALDYSSGDVTARVIGYRCELDINDFPQYARYRATTKEVFGHLREFTNVSITTRGSYIPPGRTAPLGERRLFLFIEGQTERQVARARDELLKILSQAIEEARGSLETIV